MSETTNGTTSEPTGVPRTQSLDRAITLLRAVAAADPERATPAALAEATGLNRATAWRLITTLEAHGLIDRDPHSGRCTIGYTVVELAGAAGSQGLINTARPLLQQACEQTGETASLAIVRGSALTYVAEVTPPTVITAKWLGKPVGLHATSTGKALLAWLPEDEREALLDHNLTAYTDSTITHPRRLRDELEMVRERGWAGCRGEYEPSLFGVSAPVLDARTRPYAVVSIWGPSQRVTEDRFPRLGELARRVSEDLARARRELGA